MGGPKTGIIFWRGAPCSTGFSRSVCVLETHLYQYISRHCCERMCSTSVNFFLKTQHICPFYDGWFTSIPAHTTLSVQQFWTKNSMTPMPHPLYPPNFKPRDFFVCFPRWKKSSKGNILPMWKRWNKKTTEALKGIKNQWVQIVLSSGRKHRDRHQMESA